MCVFLSKIILTDSNLFFYLYAFLGNPQLLIITLVSITVTPPTRTVYSVGESFDSTGMVVTATYDDGEERTVKGTITSETSSLTKSAGINKEVTVSYTEGDNKKTATFTVDVASYQFTETVQDADSSYTGTMSGGTYKKFGDWPQTIKSAGVTVGSGTLVRGSLSYHVGSDGNYYVEAKEQARGVDKYSDGTQVGQRGTSKKWFKVEPIVWRVLTDDYKVPGENGELKSTNNALLLAENILTGYIYYVTDKPRTITGAGTKTDEPNTVYENNYKYSTIRAWLNGKYEDDDTQEENKAYKGIGFLQTAFTPEAQGLITPTTVDNSNESTFGRGDTVENNLYACGDTTDKIFLLSKQEVTMSEYGFDKYYAYGQGNNTRIRVTTDYAKATGPYKDSTDGYRWWLRSPFHRSSRCVWDILDDGSGANDFTNIFLSSGVVPALSISINGN